jgi:hypothetical protein|tara:strand:+ start:322 stop:1362 length:1041 start_codon:yes stop_codon:yes gene_type:complete
MAGKTINIGADVEDTYFKFPQQVMADIVDALHNNDKVVLKLSEGIALEELNYKEKKFLQILKELCENNNWPLDKIHISLPNLVQDKTVWPSIGYSGASILADDDITQNIFLGLQAENVKIDKAIKKSFGIFIHRSQWDRLLLSSYLYKNYKDITMQTFRKDLKDPAHMVEIGLDQLFWLLSCYNKLDATLIQQLCDFISSLPHNNGIEWQRTNQQTTVDQKITGWYNNIFLDIVCEKMVTGQTFFPTEKTARPLATKTPFLIMAAPNYIKNLNKIGFRSFGEFWDESYDYQQGVQRVESIQRIIDDLAKLDKGKLEDMYQEMSPILEHNYKTYHSLTGNDISSKFL